MKFNLRIQRNRARTLQKCLEAAEKGERLETILMRYPEHAGWLHEQIDTLGWIQQRQESVLPRPDFMIQSHSSLVNQLGQSLTPAARLRRKLTRRLYSVQIAFQTLVLILLSLILYNVGDHTIWLAQRALPGDLVYPLKQFGEDATLAFTFSPEHDAHLHLYYTRERTLELQELLLEGSTDQAVVAASRFQTQIQHTKQALKVLARLDPRLAQEMQSQMSASLQEQGVVLLLLTDRLPHSLQSGVEAAVLGYSP